MLHFFLITLSRTSKHTRPVKDTERFINTLEKQKDFVRAVDSVRHRFPSLRQACQYAAARMQAPQFYMEIKSADFLIKNPQKVKGVTALKSIDLYLMMQQPSPLRYREQLAQILLQPAPSFYIEPQNALYYYYRAIKAIRKNKQFDN